MRRSTMGNRCISSCVLSNMFWRCQRHDGAAGAAHHYLSVRQGPFGSNSASDVMRCFRLYSHPLAGSPPRRQRRMHVRQPAPELSIIHWHYTTSQHSSILPSCQQPTQTKCRNSSWAARHKPSFPRIRIYPFFPTSPLTVLLAWLSRRRPLPSAEWVYIHEQHMVSLADFSGRFRCQRSEWSSSGHLQRQSFLAARPKGWVHLSRRFRCTTDTFAVITDPTGKAS